MDQFLKTLSDAADTLHQFLPYTTGFILLLYIIQLMNVIVGYRLNILGIWPRKKWGWIGIPFSPFLHGSWGHLIVNSIPLFIFSNLILLQGVYTFLMVSGLIILIGGLLVWLFGRSGIHVGASGLIMGDFGYITIGIYHNPTPLSFLAGAGVLVYFSSMFTNLLPSSDRKVSWEGHLLGFSAGIAAAYLSPFLITMLPRF